MAPGLLAARRAITWRSSSRARWPTVGASSIGEGLKCHGEDNSPDGFGGRRSEVLQFCGEVVWLKPVEGVGRSNVRAGSETQRNLGTKAKLPKTYLPTDAGSGACVLSHDSFEILGKTSSNKKDPRNPRCSEQVSGF